MITLRSKVSQVLISLVVGFWLLISCAVLVGMYHLFWQRERVLYLGKSPEEQRVQVWKNAGLPLKLLDTINAIEKKWPKYACYAFTGQHDKKSYGEYLLVPRVPAGSDEYIINTDGSYTSIPVSDSVEPESSNDRSQTRWTGLSGFLFSVASLFGIAFLLKAVSRSVNFSFPEYFSLACLLVFGAGLFSKIFFLNLGAGFLISAILGAAGIVYRLYFLSGRFFREKGKTGMISSVSALKASTKTDFFLIILFLLIIGSIVWGFLMAVIVVPDDWDAWAIWGVKAKLLLLGTGTIEDVTHVGHADYPLFWPFIWAYSAWCGGGWEESWSRGWSAVFYLMVLWEIVVIVNRYTMKKFWSVFAAAVFATVPMVPVVVSWSYAEAPFWLLTVSSFCCLLVWKESGSRKHIVIGALLAVGAAYTKNEGVLFSLIMMIWLAVNCAVDSRKRFYHLLIFILVFAFCYFPWLIWVKMILHLGSHATAGLLSAGTDLHRVTERIPKAIKSIIVMWSDIRQWGASFYLGMALFLYTQIIRTRSIDSLIPVFMLAGYFTVIIFHHADIYWQVGTSWNRLTLHALPLIIVIAFTQMARERKNVSSVKIGC